MIKKIYILTLLGVFFTSTTGLPLTISFCNMTDLHSKGECKMHMTKKACCDKEKETVKLTQNDFDSCCQLKIVDHNLTDKFIMTGSDIGSKTPIKILSGLITIEAGANDITTHNEYTDSSPPPLLNNHIYLNNSILLI